MRGPEKRWTDAIIRSVKETLFGDAEYSGADAQQRKVEIVPIESVIEDISALSWMNWRDYAFAREPLNGRLDEDLRTQLMKDAWACGNDWVQYCQEYFHSSAPHDIAELLGAHVHFAKKPHGQDRVTFAEFIEPNEIYVYTDALDKVQSLLETPGVHEALGDRFSVEDLLLAHEIFHVLELQHSHDIWTQTYRIDLKIGPIRNPSRLVILSELAAMSFAQILTGISCSSYVLDVLLTYAYSPAAGTTLYNEVMSYQKQNVGDE